MNSSLIIKYKPKELDDFNISDYTKELINIYLKNSKLLFLIHGGTGYGKSSLINVLLNKYYKNDKRSINSNTIYINFTTLLFYSKYFSSMQFTMIYYKL